jgi:peptidoglycan/xylan/chitin deacetylase (PgdA/CDA1 family)
VNHLALPELDPSKRRAELEDGKRRLEAIVGARVDTFAYPYGAWDAATADLARDCGFAVAVTCDERRVEPGADPWRLPRVEVKPVLRGDLSPLMIGLRATNL